MNTVVYNHENYLSTLEIDGPLEIGSLVSNVPIIISQRIPLFSKEGECLHVQIEDNVVVGIENIDDAFPNFIKTVTKYQIGMHLQNWQLHLTDYVIPLLEQEKEQPHEVSILSHEHYKTLGLKSMVSIPYRLPSPLHLFAPSTIFYLFLFTDFITTERRPNVLFANALFHVKEIIKYIEVFEDITCPAVQSDSKVYSTWESYIIILKPWFKVTKKLYDTLRECQNELTNRRA